MVEATLERTAEGVGPVQDLSVEARKSVRLKGTDEAIPTLADVLDVLAVNKGIDLHVEIKIDETGTPYPDIAARVAAELFRFGVGERSHLTSFDTSVLEECRLHAPDVSRLVSVNAAWAEKQGGLAAFIDCLDGLVEIVAIHHELMEAEWDLLRSLTSDSPDLALKLRAGITA